jgi:hypothetical protein
MAIATKLPLRADSVMLNHFSEVMAGLVPAIYVLLAEGR